MLGCKGLILSLLQFKCRDFHGTFLSRMKSESNEKLISYFHLRNSLIIANGHSYRACH